jgi:hypothetical protein
MSRKRSAERDDRGEHRACDTPAALGFRAHSGWGVVVAVAGSPGAPSVIERRRVELADVAIHGSVQPYHAAAALNRGEADAFIKLCKASTRAMADRAMREVVERITRDGHRLLGSCILLASGRPAGDLSAILASHPMIHTAEGVFFRTALMEASEACGLRVFGVKERDLLNQASTQFRMSTHELQRRASELGRSIGPPWRQDEKLATIAAWLALAGQPSQ